MNWSDVKGFFLDISGVLKNGDEKGGEIAIEGSVEAVNKLVANNVPLRLVTNESQVSINKLHKILMDLGFNVLKENIISPPMAVSSILKEKSLRPHLLVHPDVLHDFSNFNTSNPNAVVVGDAAEHFTYEALNNTFHVIMKLNEPYFYTLGRGRFYKHGDGFNLDVGPFTCALEYASGKKAITVGKPSSDFYNVALRSIQLDAKHVVMVGDDIVSDVAGAQAVGMKAIQVRTGKFRACDEPHPTVTPDLYVNNLKDAVNLYFNSKTI